MHKINVQQAFAKEFTLLPVFLVFFFANNYDHVGFTVLMMLILIAFLMNQACKILDTISAGYELPLFKLSASSVSHSERKVRKKCVHVQNR